MKKMKIKVFKPLTWLIVLLICQLGFLSTNVIYAGDCRNADRLYNQSLDAASNSEKERLLTQSINECPMHAESWNNLGVLREAQGLMDEAEQCYYKATQANPDYIAAYAGLGDAFMANNKFRDASKAYKTFLAYLKEQKNKGEASDLLAYEQSYRTKLERATAESHQSGTVNSDNIIHALTVSPLPDSIRFRGRRGRRAMQRNEIPVQPQIDLQILFTTGSAQLRSESYEQLHLLVKALTSEELQDVSIRIEGHTDSRGTEVYNQTLSMKRANSVKNTLVNLGIEDSRMVTEGKGEIFPVASNDAPEGWALNRRVTFVNEDY